jgi:thiol:disulfide interchange protein
MYKALIAVFLYALAQAVVYAGAQLPEYSRVYDPARDPYTDGRTALKLARDTGRRVLVEVGGNWCSWCYALDHFINSDPMLRETLDRHFVVLKVNVSEKNPNREFLAAFPGAYGYPHMYVTDSNGTILHSQDTAEFLQDGEYSRERFLQFIDKWRRPPQPRNTPQAPASGK